MTLHYETNDRSYTFFNKIVMENLQLSNSCVNCSNHSESENICVVHKMLVSIKNTCDSFDLEERSA